jgi:predicted DNA-binding transcriptional regulator AlpA
MQTDLSDELVPDPTVIKEFKITLMTIWRWSNDPDLDFPPAIKIRNRSYRSRRALDDFKARMLQRGLAAARDVVC